MEKNLNNFKLATKIFKIIKKKIIKTLIKLDNKIKTNWYKAYF